MIQYIGWVGLCVVIISFILLATKKYAKYFIIVNLIGTLSLLIHSIIIKDLPFILAQTFIAFALITKQLKGGIR